MPRLIMIEGPRSGDSFRLGHENYIGYRNGTLAFSHRQDVGQLCCAIFGGGDRYELRNHGQPNRILVNGEGIRQALLHHGDVRKVPGRWPLPCTAVQAPCARRICRRNRHNATHRR